MKKKLFRETTLVVFALIVLIGFTGCPSTAGSNTGSGTSPSSDSFNRSTGEGTIGGIPFKMINIAAVNGGTSTVGDNSTSDNKKRPVKLSAYMLGETEVTQELWQAVMGNNPSFFDDTGNKVFYGTSYDTTLVAGEIQSKRPVDSVNWYHAIAFCNKLSLKLGLEPCYKVTVSGSDIDFQTLAYADIPVLHNADWSSATLEINKNGFRLPTVNEWEWGAKGGTENKWSGTNTESDLINYAWYSSGDGGDAGEKPHEVKKKQANGYGLYDMSGNVAEWCHDWCATITYNSGDPIPPNYTGASTGASRALRGGNWAYTANGCTRWKSTGSLPYSYEDFTLGLRLACRP